VLKYRHIVLRWVESYMNKIYASQETIILPKEISEVAYRFTSHVFKDKLEEQKRFNEFVVSKIGGF
jgi:hypothetical protein